MPLRPHARQLSVALALAIGLLAAGCKPPTATGGGDTAENSVKPAKGTSGVLNAKAREFKLNGRDGKPLNGIMVQIGGKSFSVRNGLVTLTEDVIAEGQKSGKLVVSGPGFLPLTLVLQEGAAFEATLTAAEGLGDPALIAAGGGIVATAGGRAMVNIPGAFVSGGTAFTAGTYTPGLDAAAAQAAFEKEVAAVVATRNKLAAAAGGAAAPEGACAAPFVCKPVTGALGVVLYVDGPVQAGKVSATVDLSKPMRGWTGVGTPPWEADPKAFTEAEKQDAIAAARIIETFRNIDGTNDATWRQALRQESGVTLDGTMLTFPVDLSATAAAGGSAGVATDAVTVLGTRLELTLVSGGMATPGAVAPAKPVVPGDIPEAMMAAKLPGYTAGRELKGQNGALLADNGPEAIYSLITDGGARLIDPKTGASFDPAELIVNPVGTMINNKTGLTTLTPLVSNNSGGIIADNGAGLISNNSAGIIADNGAGIIANNGTGIIANNGTGLVSDAGAQLTGYPFFPFQPEGVKYQLLQIGVPVPDPVRETVTGLREYLWPGQARVRAIMAGGAPITDWVQTDGSGGFTLKLPDDCPIIFDLEAEITTKAEDGKPRRAYALAFAPGPKKSAMVAVDASTTLISASTMHLVRYIPPEYMRLLALRASYEDEMGDLIKLLPKGTDLNKVLGGGGTDRPPPGGAKPAYTLMQSVDPALAGAIRGYDAAIDAIDARNAELMGSYAAFNPFEYLPDLFKGDATITQAGAETVSHALNLRGVYDPLWADVGANRLDPNSLLPIVPDTPPLPPPPPID